MLPKTLRVTFFMLMLLLVPLSGCGGLMATSEPVTITFVYPEPAREQYTLWAQEFHEQVPHITVELLSTEEVPYSTFPEQDTFHAVHFELPQYLANQTILNLTPFIEQDKDLNPDDFYPGVLNVFNSQGKQWALPFEADLMVMYYNKDLLDQYNAPYPQIGWTWADFLDTAMEVNDPNAGIFGYAMHYEGEYSVYEPVMFIYQHGGRIFDNLQNPSQVTLNDPLTVEAVEWYASLIHDHNIAPTYEQGPGRMQAYPWRGIIQSKFGVWIGMLSDHGGRTWPVEWEMRWGTVPLPRGQNAATMAIATGLVISSKTEHPDACWEWISFLSQKTSTFEMPARQSLAESKAYEQAVGEEVAITARAAIEDAIIVNPEIMGFETALNAMQQAFAAIRNGDAEPQAALDTAQERSGF